MRTRLDPIRVDLFGTGRDVEAVVADIFALEGSEVLTAVDRSSQVDEVIDDVLRTRWQTEHPGDNPGHRTVHTVTFDVDNMHLDRMAELIADMLARDCVDDAGAVVVDRLAWMVTTQRTA